VLPSPVNPAKYAAQGFAMAKAVVKGPAREIRTVAGGTVQNEEISRLQGKGQIGKFL
jgi:hypothetical protein